MKKKRAENIQPNKHHKGKKDRIATEFDLSSDSFIQSNKYENEIQEECRCCFQCKARISRLEAVVTQLYNYMGQYIPAQSRELHTAYQQPYLPVISQRQKEQMAAIHPAFKTINQKPLRPGQQRKKRRLGKKDLTREQKTAIVKKVQAEIELGRKIQQICRQIGISDRSYQRWKVLEDQSSQEMDSETEYLNNNIY